MTHKLLDQAKGVLRCMAAHLLAITGAVLHLAASTADSVTHISTIHLIQWKASVSPFSFKTAVLSRLEISQVNTGWQFVK